MLDEIANKQTGQQLTKDEESIIRDMFSFLLPETTELITPKKLYEVTGGLLSEKELDTLYIEGRGIEPRLRILGRVFYPKIAVMRWFENNIEID